MRNHPKKIFDSTSFRTPPKKQLNSTKNGIFGKKKTHFLQNDSRRSHITLQTIPYSFLLMDIENHPKKCKTPQKTAKIENSGFLPLFSIFLPFEGVGARVKITKTFIWLVVDIKTPPI